MIIISGCGQFSDVMIETGTYASQHMPARPVERRWLNAIADPRITSHFRFPNGIPPSQCALFCNALAAVWRACVMGVSMASTSRWRAR